MRLKLFENFNNNDFLRDIKDCFSDLTDDDNADIEYIEEYQEIVIHLLIETDYSSGNFDDFMKLKKEEFKILNQVQQALDRLNLLHNNDFSTNTEIIFEDNQYSISIEFIEGEDDKFYRIMNNGHVKISGSKLIKLLNLPRNTIIAISCNGSCDKLSFYFNEVGELREYQDSLIKYFTDLEVVDGEPFCGDEFIKNKSKYVINYNEILFPLSSKYEFVI